MSPRGDIFNKAISDFQKRAYNLGGPAALSIEERTRAAMVLVVDTNMRKGNWPCAVELDLQQRGHGRDPLKGRLVASFCIGEARDLAERNYLCALAEAVACVLVRDFNVSLNNPNLLHLGVHHRYSVHSPWPQDWPDKDTVLGLARTLLTLSRLDAPESTRVDSWRMSTTKAPQQRIKGARADMIVIDELVTDSEEPLW